MCVCVCAKFDQFLPVRSHFDTKRPVNFFHIATFPSPTFGPLFAFHCPLFFTKNNNLECRDVLKTVSVTSDQRRFRPYTAHNQAQMVKRFHGSRRFIFTGSWSATHVLLSFVFYEKQAICRRQFAAGNSPQYICDVFMCGSYRIAGSELPRGLGAYVRVLY